MLKLTPLEITTVEQKCGDDLLVNNAFLEISSRTRDEPLHGKTRSLLHDKQALFLDSIEHCSADVYIKGTVLDFTEEQCKDSSIGGATNSLPSADL